MKKFTYKITAKNKNKLVFFSCVYNVHFEKHLCASRPMYSKKKKKYF